MLGVAFSYTKLIPSRVVDVNNNRRVASSSINGNYFTVKESEYVFGAAPSEMYNHAGMHVFGRNLEPISQCIKVALFHLSFPSI